MNHLRLLQLLQVSLNFLFSFLLSPKMSSCCSLSSLKKRINESFLPCSRSFFNQKTVDNDSIFDYCHLFPRSLSIKRSFFSKRWDRITIALQHQSTKSRWRSLSAVWGGGISVIIIMQSPKNWQRGVKIRITLGLDSWNYFAPSTSVNYRVSWRRSTTLLSKYHSILFIRGSFGGYDHHEYSWWFKFGERSPK